MGDQKYVTFPTATARDGKGVDKKKTLLEAKIKEILAGESADLLPTESATQYGYNQSGSAGSTKRYSLNSMASLEIKWGRYEPAIRRWETVIGRPAPAPTETGPKGNSRLSPAFVEWMMGLEDGWVTDFTFARKHIFRLLGNGVVPQQAVLAITELLDWYTTETGPETNQADTAALAA